MRMQNIRLEKMLIRNFKGIRELDIDFDGKDMNVLGNNGTGKTSIIDSFTWLLFGKDSLGRADFGIKPMDKAGNVIHQLETSVEAVFNISGVEKTFKKTLTEVWTRKRGAVEAEFTGNENTYYIDGVPKKKGEYTAAIKELIDEEVFKIITNPLYFNESVKWQDRRSVLLTICGEVSDEDVIAANSHLAPLLPLLNGRTVSDFKDITASLMKRVNKDLEMIPVKINEAELAKPSVEALEVNQAHKATLETEIENLRRQKSEIQNGTAILQERRKLDELNRSLRVSKAFDPTQTDEAKEIARLKSKRSELLIQINETTADMDTMKYHIGQMQSIRERLSKEWDEVFAEQFTDSICPTCHRELPEDEVEERRKEFNRKKASRLDDIEQHNADAQKEFKALEERRVLDESIIATAKERLEKVEIAISNAEVALKALVNQKASEHEKEQNIIYDSILSIQEKIRAYEENNVEAVQAVEREIISRSNELAAINEAIANKALLERQEKRIADLRDEQIRLASEYNTAERHLYLAEQFIVAKVDMLNERINQKFKYAKFKLFDKQINGGINEVCEVTYNGVAYKDLNNAMRINIGLDVINTIAAHYGVTCPILIDNAESVNELFHTEAQQIRFYVTTDRKLIFENEY